MSLDDEVRYDPKLHGSGRFSRFIRELLDHLGPVRRIVKSDAVESLIYVARVSREVRSPVSFLKDQFFGPAVAPVAVRSSGTEVFVRRRSEDLVMFHQIIGRDGYLPPEQVLSALAGRQAPLRIADLGGNVGFFTVSMLDRFPGSEVIAIEADPANADVFARTIEANGWQERVELRQVAAGAADGPVNLAGGDFFRSRVVAADEASTATETIPGIDVLPLLSDRDLIKIDIEGSEWPILADPRFRELNAVAIAMEWHRAGCPGPEPVAVVDEALRAAGFETAHDFTDADCGTLWAWKTPGAATP